MTPEECRWTFSWVDLALDYQEQNRELRALLLELLLAWKRERELDLRDFALAELAARWSGGRSGA